MKVELEKEISAGEIREIFQNRHDNLVEHDHRKVLMSHYGTFSQDLVSGLSGSTEGLLVSAGDKRIVIKRTFSILIEGLQNIRLHGQRDDLNRQLGFVILAGSEKDYKIVMANVINPDDIPKVERYLDEINHYSLEELKSAYLKVLSSEFISKKGGAGLGFIITRMKSGNPLKYSFYALKNGQMLFTFEISLNR